MEILAKIAFVLYTLIIVTGGVTAVAAVTAASPPVGGGAPGGGAVRLCGTPDTEPGANGFAAARRPVVYHARLKHGGNPLAGCG